MSSLQEVVVTPNPTLAARSYSTFDEDERAQALAKAQQEHEDFHVAQDLAKTDSSGTPRFRPSTAPVTERPSKRKKPATGKGVKKGSGAEKGIAKFFVSK